MIPYESTFIVNTITDAEKNYENNKSVISEIIVRLEIMQL
jgi:hypothetical protein